MSYNCFSKYYMDERLKVKSKRCFFFGNDITGFLKLHSEYTVCVSLIVLNIYSCFCQIKTKKM